MSITRDSLTRGEPASAKRRPRSNRGPDNAAPSFDAADESGNRALHAVASGPNPNVGRDDVERAVPGQPREGGVEST
jgi:hypothetical protein